MTPGPWIHVGGDEPLSTSPDDYLDLVRRITAAATANGKTVMGWHELGASSELPAGTVGQYWDFVVPRDDTAELTRSFVDQGGRVILSPADVAYLDMQYPDDAVRAPREPAGPAWADGPTSLEEAYGWEPTAVIPNVAEDDILGIAAPIWTETIATTVDLEFMVFPRTGGDRRDRLVAGAGGRCSTRHRGVLREGRPVRGASRRDGGRLPPGARGGLDRVAGCRVIRSITDRARCPDARRAYRLKAARLPAVARKCRAAEAGGGPCQDRAIRDPCR